jgi:hypothetical protein
VNTHVTGWIKTGEEAKATHFKEVHKLTGEPPPGTTDDQENVAKLPIWQRTSTLLKAKHVTPTGAAILPYATVSEKDLPRVPKWRAILKEINWEKHGFVRPFLANVIHWHHRSTNGRFNETIGRFERWGVKSVVGWYTWNS